MEYEMVLKFKCIDCGRSATHLIFRSKGIDKEKEKKTWQCFDCFGAEVKKLEGK